MTDHLRNPSRGTVVLDPSKCRGHGICSLASRGLIGLDEWGFAELNRLPVEGRSMRLARAAVLACPAKALALELLPEPLLIAGAQPEPPPT